MRSASCKGRGGLDTVELVHASGATVTVYLWGATLTSYCTAQREEMIFVSPGAVFDGRQPIRGGVPVVFPQFGRPNQNLPMHGFARTTTWAVDAIVDAAEETREPYPQPRPRLIPASLPSLA
jgi:D-hexose-6-phosphate mutarotase